MYSAAPVRAVPVALIAVGLIALNTPITAAGADVGKPRSYTAEELAETVPDEPNPYLAFLPSEAEPDWRYWRARMAYDGRQREDRRIRSGSTIEWAELESSSLTGRNDLPPFAEPVPGFGSRTGQVPRARITGTIRPLPTMFDPGTPGGTIPTAPLLVVAAGERVAVDGVIGDSPFGSGGSGTGDFDFFRVTVTAGQRLEMLARTPVPLGDLDPLIGLYSPAGVLLDVNDNLPVDGFVETFDSYLDFEATADGDLFIVVAGKSIFGPNQDEEDHLPTDPFDPASGPGADSEGDYQLVVALDAADPGDIDCFRVELRAGDVIGATVTGDARRVSVSKLDGSLLIESRIDASGVFPDTSPLPGGGKATAAYVIDSAGTYAIGVRTVDPLGVGPYVLNVAVARAGLDQQSSPARQLIYLDFDGATFDGTVFDRPPGPITLSPLTSYLDGWGLSPADEDTVIDAILATAERQLDDEIGAMGRNGDFDTSGIIGQFDIELRNSRDHPDPASNPQASRVVVGGSIAELGIPTIGLAQSIDPGNFATAEIAVVLLDLLSSPDPDNPNSLNSIERAPGVDLVSVIGAGVGSIVSHEVGHMVANFHTRRDIGPPAVMDRGGNLGNFLGLGDDGIFGTGDDLHVGFVLDGYTPVEGLSGDENTLDAVAFDLARGGLRPDLAIDALVLDFGPVPVGADRTLDLRVSNEGSEPLTGTVALAGGRGGGAFTIDAGAGAFTLAPAQARTVTVRFQALGLGSALGSLAINSDDGDQPMIAVPLRGQGGVPMASAIPVSIDFGDLIYGDADTSIDHTVTLSNGGPGTLEVLGLERTGPQAAGFIVEPDPAPFSMAPGAKRDLQVRFLPGGPVGPMQALLRIRSNDPSQPLDIPLSGTAIGPDIDVTPSSPYFFPVTRVGETRDRTFTVHNVGTRDLNVGAVVLTGKDAGAFALLAGARPFTLTPGATHTIDVRFMPGELGEVEAVLELLSNDPDEDPLDYILQGLGVLPQASVNPTSVDFGDAGIGITRFRFLEVINDGNGRLFVQPPQVLGPDADRFTLNVNSLFFVDPNDTLEILARFTPDAVRGFEATVRLETDDPTRPIIDVPFSGEGIAPALALDKTCSGPVTPHCIVAVDNVGPGDATGVTVTDALPSGVVWIGDDCGAGPPVGATWTWSVGALAEGEGAICVLELAATDDAPPSVTNTVTAHNDLTPAGGDVEASATVPLHSVTEIPVLGRLGTTAMVLLLLAIGLARLRRA